MEAPWPRPFISDAAWRPDGVVMRLVTEVRWFRSDQGLRPGQRVAARLAGIETGPLAGHEERIRFLLRLGDPGPGFTASAAIEAEGVTVELDTAGVIDIAAERRRMEKDLAAARKEAGQAQAKLGSAGFMAKAPARWWTRPASASPPPTRTSRVSPAAWPSSPGSGAGPVPLPPRMPALG